MNWWSTDFSTGKNLDQHVKFSVIQWNTSVNSYWMDSWLQDDIFHWFWWSFDFFTCIIYIPLRMNCEIFGHLLPFHLVPTLGQNWSSNLVYGQISAKLMTLSSASALVSLQYNEQKSLLLCKQCHSSCQYHLAFAVLGDDNNNNTVLINCYDVTVLCLLMKYKPVSLSGCVPRS